MDDPAVRRIRTRLKVLEREKRARWRDYCDWIDGKDRGRKPKFSESELEEIPGLKAALQLLSPDGRTVASDQS